MAGSRWGRIDRGAGGGSDRSIVGMIGRVGAGRPTRETLNDPEKDEEHPKKTEDGNRDVSRVEHRLTSDV